MYRLYGFFTQNTLKTLYVLEEVGAEFEFEYVNLSEAAHKTEEFAKKTAMGAD